MVERARLAMLGGKNDEETAIIVGVSLRLYQQWKATRPEFSAGSEWKQRAVKVVEASLYQRATGFEAPDVHVSNFQGAVTVTPILKYYPPDTAAAKLFLEKQAPKEWGETEQKEAKLVNINISFGDPVSLPVSPQAIDIQSQRVELGASSDTPSAGQASEGQPWDKKEITW